MTATNRRCPWCDASVVADARFCHNCGAIQPEAAAALPVMGPDAPAPVTSPVDSPAIPSGQVPPTIPGVPPVGAWDAVPFAFWGDAPVASLSNPPSPPGASRAAAIRLRLALAALLIVTVVVVGTRLAASPDGLPRLKDIASAPPPGASTTASDPRILLADAFTQFSGARTYHVEVRLDGTIPFDATGSGQPGIINLAGLTAGGDIDNAEQKARLRFSAPSLAGMTGDVILIDDTVYTQISVIGPKYQRTVNTVPFAPADTAASIARLRDIIGMPSAAATLLPEAACGNEQCYHASFRVSAQDLEIATGQGAPGASDVVVLEVLIHRTNLWIASLDMTIPIQGQAPLQVHIDISGVNEPVSISAPPDSQIMPSINPGAAPISG